MLMMYVADTGSDLPSGGHSPILASLSNTQKAMLVQGLLRKVNLVNRRVSCNFASPVTQCMLGTRSECSLRQGCAAVGS